jgi:hypothetical protein
MKRIPLIFTVVLSASFIIGSCGGSEDKKESEEKSTETKTETTGQTEVHGTEFKPGDVTVTSPLNPTWVAAGQATYNLKCQSCHKLTEERLVGPGWKGVTQRRQPHWIMNMVTNVDMMLEKDPDAQKLLEQCLVRMPNQNLNKDQAREVLEFMRSNDGAQ